MGLVSLRLPVQRLVHNQLWKLAAVAFSLHIQNKEVVCCQMIVAQRVGAHIWIVRALQNVARGKLRSIVIHIQHSHLHAKTIQWATQFAQFFSVDFFLDYQLAFPLNNPLRREPQIFSNVSNHRSGRRGEAGEAEAKLPQPPSSGALPLPGVHCAALRGNFFTTLPVMFPLSR
uniref:Uncharacterized protein n=1 Tax=Oryzias latipes TaxID=8090 RepID=A0A3P9IHH4_ORYLA